MKQNRVNRVLKALEDMGLSQMLIVDPMTIYYLTGVYIAPFERFYGLYLRADGKHVYYLDRLLHVPEDVGIEKVWYSDTDPVAELIAERLDKNTPLGVDKDLRASFLLPLIDRRAAAGFINASVGARRTRGGVDAGGQGPRRAACLSNMPAGGPCVRGF